ncbi:hypothetical protein A2837_02205 [Candidatus Kaiserbacteria bacterium RIFCSPHIGHO2_01_FULL_46_22]|uniref:Uncharacterized protein n=1 Tax=Candidatus Kaiserbacteria bacterium RIFCSPHIGHO2_01_FULL_46_22 TaxID=1798475 RepID=A0A1F6BZQ7_9BACT|nr:MAG: hypothetical protein A2837_02205 [Candidatus Kaiserbacteria bacterium RIFCSPHIGHO2_01_FULL_46_22]
MNTGKLLSVLNDLELDESNLEHQAHLNDLLVAIEQNNAELIETSRNELIQSFEKGRAINFLPSEISVLKKLAGEEFYGKKAIKKLASFFDHDLFKLKENVTSYRSERKTFRASIKTLIECLESNNFETHYETNEYEVGIILPDRYLELDSAVEALSKWNKFLNTLCDVKGIEKTKKISLVSQGSIEVYILAAYPLALSINIILDELVKMYQKISFIRESELKLKILNNESLQATLKTEREKVQNEFTINVTNELLKSIEFKDEASKNESFSKLKAQLGIIFKLHQDGVSLEIKPPEIETDEEEGGEVLSEVDRKKRQKELVKISAETSVIQKTNRNVIEANFKESQKLLEKVEE